MVNAENDKKVSVKNIFRYAEALKIDILLVLKDEDSGY